MTSSTNATIFQLSQVQTDLIASLSKAKGAGVLEKSPGKFTSVFCLPFARWRYPEQIEKTRIAVKCLFETLEEKFKSADSAEVRKNYSKTLKGYFPSLSKLERTLKALDVKISEYQKTYLALKPEGTIQIECDGEIVEFRSDLLKDEAFKLSGSLCFNINNPNVKRLFFYLISKPGCSRLKVSKNGQLEIVSRLRWCFSKKEKSKEKIQQTLSLLINHLNAQKFQDSEEMCANVLLRKLFFSKNKLKGFSQNLFKREKLIKASKLSCHLSPEFKTAREAFLNELQNQGLPNEEALVNKAIEYLNAERVLAQRLGVKIGWPSGGSGGARFVKERSGKNVAVIKPEDEGPHGKNNPKKIGKVKSYFIWRPRCLQGNDEFVAETLSYRVDRIFKLGQVPPTDYKVIENETFYGSFIKTCSIQFFVEESKSLGSYLGISKGLNLLPRAVSRWYLGGLDEKQKKQLPSFVQKSLEKIRNVFGGVKKQKEIESKLPEEFFKRSFETLALANFLGGDIDCHFDNILVQKHPLKRKESLTSRVLTGQEKDPKVLGKYVDKFFTKHFQDFNRHFLVASKPFEIEEKGKKEKVAIRLIKPDGGSSYPHSHPSSYRATRYKHLFEILPQFNQPFSDESIKLFSDNEKFDQVIDVVAYHELKSFFQSINAVTEFDAFWKGNKQLIEEWMALPRKGQELKSKTDEILKLLTFKRGEEEAVSWHLTRIHDCICTRRESWKVVNYFFKNKRDEPMRKLFKIQSHAQFEKWLEKIEKPNSLVNLEPALVV